MPETVDTELLQLNISEEMRGISAFMKVMATLFHYGNQPMNAAQLVGAVRALDLLPLRGETPKSTIQGIISTARKAARGLKQPDPFDIAKDGAGRQTKYSIADFVLNGVQLPPIQEIPDEPMHIKPVENSSSSYSYSSHLGKQQRKPSSDRNGSRRRRTNSSKLKRKRTSGYDTDSDGNGFDVDVDMDDESMSIDSGADEANIAQSEEDTIFDYSLLYAPPPADMNYLDPINFVDYPIAANFAAVQQKGYSYPRFRSHEKIKIPKIHCEDRFRVADIHDTTGKKVVGRVFILADGHGGRGCSEYFVRKTPRALEKVCAEYNPQQLDNKEVQERFEHDIKLMVESLDEDYLTIKRAQLSGKSDSCFPGKNESEKTDNDGCTLILNVFFGDWLVNVNVGDSRTILISAPEPSSAPVTMDYPLTGGVDKDYLMEVVFASQDHKPYLEHLAREILENGGEFVDSVQNRIIKVELDKLREDGNRQAKRIALKNARIRPKDYQVTHDQANGDTSVQGWATQSAVRTTANNVPAWRAREDRIPSLNVARSCGDLDFKLNPKQKIISCEPDVTFIRISDGTPEKDPNNNSEDSSKEIPPRTMVTSSAHKEKRRHFLFMSTDGTFDYMYEEAPDKQNRVIAKAIGAMVEDGEKAGRYILEQEEHNEGQTIEHTSSSIEGVATLPTTDNVESVQKGSEIKNTEQLLPTVLKQPESVPEAKAGSAPPNEDMSVEATEKEPTAESDAALLNQQEPRKPLLFRELTKQEEKIRKLKERTLTMAARYFANREGAHGFFASKLQDYDDCTVMLIEI
ncbi:phosphatase 2C-like domain-containing protein [Phycomyces blakesleeanus]